MHGRTSCSPCAGPPACAWSGPTASAWPTSITGPRSTPRSRRGSCHPAPSRSPPRAQRSGSPPSTRRPRAGSGSPPSSRWATKPTSPATTSSSTGSRTRRARCWRSTSRPSATRGASGRVVRRITQEKPVIAVKSGRAAAGQRAAASRTGALLAAADVTVDALFAHAGVLRAESVGEMFDVAGLLAHQPLPRGDRVVVLTNAAGPGRLCADACEAAGLRIEPPSSAARARLAEGLRARGIDRQPGEHDRLGDRGPVRAFAADPARRRRGGCRRDDLRPPARGSRGRGRPSDRRRRGGRRPAGARRLARRRHARGRGHRRRAALHHAGVRGAGAGARRPARAPPRRAAGPPFDAAEADTATAATIVAASLGWLPPGDVERLLHCWGISLVASRQVVTAAAAGRAAQEFGGAVALKGVVPGVADRTEAGAVRLRLWGQQP